MKEHEMCGTNRSKDLSLIDPPIAAVTLRFPVSSEREAEVVEFFQGKRTRQNIKFYNAVSRVSWRSCGGSPVVSQTIRSDISMLFEGLEQVGFSFVHAYIARKEDRCCVSFGLRRLRDSDSVREKEMRYLKEHLRPLPLKITSEEGWGFETFRSLAVGRNYSGLLFNFHRSPWTSSLRVLGEVRVEPERIVIH